MVSKYRLYRVEKSAQGFVLLAKVCPWQENHYSVIKKTFGQQTVLPQFFAPGTLTFNLRQIQKLSLQIRGQKYKSFTLVDHIKSTLLSAAHHSLLQQWPKIFLCQNGRAYHSKLVKFFKRLTQLFTDNK